MTLRSVPLIAIAILLACGPAQAGDLRILAGQPVNAVLNTLRANGLPLAWSSNLVPDDLPVLAAPRSTDPLTALGEVLAPHGLEVRATQGIYLVIRASAPPIPPTHGTLMVIVRDHEAGLIDTELTVEANPALPEPTDLGSGVYQYRDASPGQYEFHIAGPGFEPTLRVAEIWAGQAATLHVMLLPAPAELETLAVSASRYVLQSNSQFFIDQRAIQTLPDIGDDPIRSVHRLPGTAAGGWSARSHFRGGEENETAIFLNGLQLLDPFHVRDFHNVFSSIDARTIAGVEAYTGGFPVVYGDRTSGILLLQSQRPEKPRRHELGISVFNTSVLTSGFNSSGRVDWLLSARRSNLEWVLDKNEHGQPSYNDLFGELGFNLSERTRITLNAQRADDGVLVVTENKPEEQEFARSDTLNENYWVQVTNEWTPRLFSETVLSASSFSNDRNAVANDPEQLVGQVYDQREVDILALRQDWVLDLSDRHGLKWGFELKDLEARYRYISRAEYRGVYLLFPGVPENIARDIRANPRGHAYSAYVSDRWQITPFTTLDAGLRWDRQTWQGPASDSQVSPRLSLLHSLSERVDLRLTWGRYNQSQGIHELQVEDGVETFFPAQESDHFIAGLTYRWPPGYSLRLEAFHKDYSVLKPRFENLHDPLPLIPEFEVDRILLTPASAASRGFEATIEQDLGAELSWWASYSWSRVNDRVGGGDEPRNWDQRHSAQAGLAWLPGPWEFGAALKAHSGWPTTDAFLLGSAEEGYRIVYGSRNARNLNTFFNLDIRIARVWSWRKSRLTAFVEISNLTNRENECCVDYDVDLEDAEEEGETPVLERSVDHWLGFTPAVGLLWEF